MHLIRSSGGKVLGTLLLLPLAYIMAHDETIYTYEGRKLSILQ
jgi:hypothetical protein